VLIEAFLPVEAAIDLDLTSSNGGITLSKITGNRINLRTSNGGLNFFNIVAKVIDAETSNGGIVGVLEASDTRISTSNGKMELELLCTETSKYILDTSNGGVDLRVSSKSEVGYSLDLSTSNGVINVDLPNLSYTTDQKTRKVARTEDFTSKDVQITIKASTSNSSMDVDT
jgi:DUF4097 and DUF4098 domain-containing protein YvlB